MKTLAFTLAALVAGLSLAQSAPAAPQKTRAQLQAEQAQQREANSQKRIAELIANRQAANNQQFGGSANMANPVGVRNNATGARLNSRQREQLRQLEARRRAEAYRRGFINGRLNSGLINGGWHSHGPTYILPPQQYVFVPGVGFVPLAVNYGWGF